MPYRGIVGPCGSRRVVTYPSPQVVSLATAVIAYWITTVAVAAEFTVGGVWDLLRIDHVRNTIEHLGYPTNLLTIMGVWKVPGAVTLLIPRLPGCMNGPTPARSSRP